MKTFIEKSTVILTLLFLSACTALPKHKAVTITSQKPISECPSKLQKLCTAYNTVQNQYIKEMPNDALTDIFINGAIKELNEKLHDPYSRYTSLKDRETEMVHNDRYAGLGMNIKKDTRAPYSIKVQGVFRGTPAHEAGIKRGDKIIAINGIPVSDKTVEESRDLIRGKIGTRVSLIISRPCEGLPFTVFIKRKSIEDTISGIAKIISPHYAYVYIPSFEVTNHIALRTKYSLKKLEELFGKPHGLIIDLRNNPGGNVAEAQAFLSLFIEGIVMRHKGRNGKEYSRSTVPHTHNLFSAPIVVLVNEDSKSAAEIVAGALQDQKRATIVGVKTFGKGVMQTQYILQDTSELYITTAYTLTPHHTPIDKTGIIPNIFVEEGNDESCTGDLQLKAALDFLKEKNKRRTVVAQQ